MELIKHPRHVNHGFLFLQGVFKRDGRKLEDMLKDQLLWEDSRDISLDIQDVKGYNTIPVQFNNEETWPKSTNVQCWWCTLNFDSVPRFIPISIEPTTDGVVGTVILASELKKTPNKKAYIISTKGLFCSFNCVSAYICIHTHDMFDRLNKLSMLKFVYEMLTKKKARDIKSSPHPTDMIQFGGLLSISQYQAKIKVLEYEN